jgi:hypothetical protein
MNKFDIAANIAFFLLERTGSVCGKWSGNLSAKEQRELFGVVYGKGTIYIDGAKETVEHVVKTGFGGDSESTYVTTFGTMDKGSNERFDAFYSA